MMKLLLTGANGFVGSYFTRQYKDKYDIHVFSFLQDDFEALHIKGVDVVFHLSALVHQPNAHEELYQKINVENTLQLAKKAKKEDVRHFIFMSTIAVYDGCLNSIYENSKLNPITPYGKSKLEAERKLQELEGEGFMVSIIRPPMVYGHNAPGNIKSLMNLVEKVPILPFGNIENKRSFVYVGNLCALLECIIQKQQRGIFLVSDDKALSTTQLIQAIATVKKRSCWLFALPFFPQLLKWLKPSFYKRLFESLEVDNRETKRLLAFENPYTVEEGIGFMVHGEKQ